MTAPAAEPLTLERLLCDTAKAAAGYMTIDADEEREVAEKETRRALAALTPAARRDLIAELAAGLPESEASARYAHQRADGEAFAAVHYYLPRLDVVLRRDLTEEERALLAAYPVNVHGARCGSLPLRRIS